MAPATKKRAAAAKTPNGQPRKRGRPSNSSKKEQKTIEETINNAEDGVEDDKDVAKQINDDSNDANGLKDEKNGSFEDVKDDHEDSKDASQDEPKKNGSSEEIKEGDDGSIDISEDKPKMNGSSVEVQDDGERSKDISEDKPKSEDSEYTSKANSKPTNGLKNGEKNAFDGIKGDSNEVKHAAKEEQDQNTEELNQNNESVVEDSAREAVIPSSILEKGIIYFFFRGRVGVEDPQGLEDVARSYIVLRPIPLGAKIGEGPLEDSGNARLLALPKKMLPKSKQDRFLMFVEKPKQFIKDIREQFEGNEYATKTSGTSNSPAATPFAEGVYAITSTGRESHLAYYITVPEKIGEVQKELGLFEKGSFVVSAKNPNAPGPANATLDNPAQYPSDLQAKFRDLRWMPLIPELLDYEHTQFLVIGEGMGDTEKAMQEMSKDKKDEGKEKPVEELKQLGEEDHDRVESLKEDDPVFADLGLSSKEFVKMSITW